MSISYYKGKKIYFSNKGRLVENDFNLSSTYIISIIGFLFSHQMTIYFIIGFNGFNGKLRIIRLIR